MGRFFARLVAFSIVLAAIATLTVWVLTGQQPPGLLQSDVTGIAPVTTLGSHR